MFLKRTMAIRTMLIAFAHHLPTCSLGALSLFNGPSERLFSSDQRYAFNGEVRHFPVSELAVVPCDDGAQGGFDFLLEILRLRRQRFVFIGDHTFLFPNQRNSLPPDNGVGPGAELAVNWAVEKREATSTFSRFLSISAPRRMDTPISCDKLFQS